MKQYRFTMALPAHKLMQYYRGNAKYVVVTSDCGLKIQLPIDVLRPYVTQQGIYGAFVVHVDDNHKFLRLEQI